ncbi:hypothetical protein THERMOT_567 [Bathymodiolus thermophilus thioautotrophic gill symbiont]|nr:hypothetical protein THERMOT_567 [Bathymodiolus thermophilus thioautotrophic gill symbiont]
MNNRQKSTCYLFGILSSDTQQSSQESKPSFSVAKTKFK